MRLIDADALKQEYYRQRNNPRADYNHMELRMLNNAILTVNSMPTIDPQNHGHWIHFNEQRTIGLLNMIKCSVCGNTKIWSSDDTPAYCQLCGSKME